eukprot:scaffold1154_cov200-Cylindrotheca_fusiformis.AAC.4
MHYGKNVIDPVGAKVLVSRLVGVVGGGIETFPVDLGKEVWSPVVDVAEAVDLRFLAFGVWEGGTAVEAEMVW